MNDIQNLVDAINDTRKQLSDTRKQLLELQGQMVLESVAHEVTRDCLIVKIAQYEKRPVQEILDDLYKKTQEAYEKRLIEIEDASPGGAAQLDIRQSDLSDS